MQCFVWLKSAILALLTHFSERLHFHGTSQSECVSGVQTAHLHSCVT
jgi:hypothetical protein